MSADSRPTSGAFFFQYTAPCASFDNCVSQFDLAAEDNCVSQVDRFSIVHCPVLAHLISCSSLLALLTLISFLHG